MRERSCVRCCDTRRQMGSTRCHVTKRERCASVGGQLENEEYEPNANESAAHRWVSGGIGMMRTEVLGCNYASVGVSVR